MERAILSREQPTRARLTALATLAFTAFCAALSAPDALAAALALAGLCSSVIWLTDMVITLHYRHGFSGRTVLTYRVGEIKIWSRGRFTGIDPQGVRDWSTRGGGERRTIGLRLRNGDQLLLRPRIADAAAETAVLKLLERFLGEPRHAPPGAIVMVPYASCA